jgi:AcrR family transcriptional regulator
MTKAAATRLAILEKAYELIYANGYQTTSVDDIIATTKVTKGAFYYHFKNKDEMGLAIINEILAQSNVDEFKDSFQDPKDPSKVILDMINHLLFKNPSLVAKYGCPVSNLTQEMTPWHKGFTKALTVLNTRMRNLLTDTIKSGIKSGYYKKTINPQQVCDFIISGYWGVRNLGKLNNNTECYKSHLKELKNYLDGLR